MNNMKTKLNIEIVNLVMVYIEKRSHDRELSFNKKFELWARSINEHLMNFKWCKGISFNCMGKL
jgi:hypothetical protein